MLDTANFLSLIIHKSKSAYTCLINASGPRELFSTKFVCYFDGSTFQTLIFFFVQIYIFYILFNIRKCFKVPIQNHKLIQVC